MTSRRPPIVASPLGSLPLNTKPGNHLQTRRIYIRQIDVPVKTDNLMQLLIGAIVSAPYYVRYYRTHSYKIYA